MSWVTEGKTFSENEIINAWSSAIPSVYKRKTDMKMCSSEDLFKPLAPELFFF